MKTFETEKHSIPDGATHTYDHGGSKCGYYKLVDGNWFYWDWCKAWYALIDNQPFYDAIPITQTNIEIPEEKEALDLIDTTPHQYEVSKFSDNEWSCEGLPPVGSLCKVNRDSFTYRVMYSSNYVVIVQNIDNDNTTAHGMDIILDLHKGNYTFSKPETEAERVERERLEAAYDLYCEFTNSNQEDATCMSMYGFKMSQVQRKWLAIVDKTNYRKESE